MSRNDTKALIEAVWGEAPAMRRRAFEILQQTGDTFTVPGGRVGYECPIVDVETRASIVLEFPATWTRGHINNVLNQVMGAARAAAPRVGMRHALRSAAAHMVAAAEYAMLVTAEPDAQA